MPRRTDLIVIYGQQRCGACKEAVAYLDGLRIPHIYRDIADPGHRRDMYARNPQASTVPQIFHGDTLIGGRDELVKLSGAQLQQMIGGR